MGPNCAPMILRDASLSALAIDRDSPSWGSIELFSTFFFPAFHCGNILMQIDIGSNYRPNISPTFYVSKHPHCCASLCEQIIENTNHSIYLTGNFLPTG